jgi:hypothetical protein
VGILKSFKPKNMRKMAVRQAFQPLSTIRFVDVVTYFVDASTKFLLSAPRQVILGRIFGTKYVLRPNKTTTGSYHF